MIFKALIIFNKRLVALGVPSHPVGDLGAQYEVIGLCCVELVGEGAEETVAVAECAVEAEAEGGELCYEGVGGIGIGELGAIQSFWEEFENQRIR
jgi:hypothetical protein